MKRGRAKTEIRMFSNGKARILKNNLGKNRESVEFLVSVFSDFYKDYIESKRTSPKEKRKHYSVLAKTSERIDLTERGGAILERATDKASAITDRLSNLLARAMLPFKNLQLFKVAGSPERSLMSIAAYVKAVYNTIYKMVQGQVADPHSVALAAAKVAANFIITIKTAIIVSSLSDEEVDRAAAEAGITDVEEQIEESIAGEEAIAQDLREQVSALVNKYRIAYKMLGITKIIPNITQNIRKIVFATLATQYPELNISPTVYSIGAFAYNEMINKLVAHILGNTSQVAQSKKPRRFSDLTEDALETQESADITTKIAPVYDEDYDEGDDDYDDEFETDYDYEVDEDEGEFIEVGDLDEEPIDEIDETADEVTEEDLENAIADIEVSPQSKRLARKFAEENPEGFRNYDELKGKLYSFLIRHLFRFRFYSESEEADETKEQIADVVDRLDKIEEKLTSLEEAVEKVIEASTVVAESEEDTSEEEDEAFDLFLEKDKDEGEEDTNESEDTEDTEESEDSSEDEGSDEEKETDEEDESKEAEEEKEEEKAQSRRKKLFSDENKRRRLGDMLEDDEYNEYDEYFSRKLKHKMPKKTTYKSEKRLSEGRAAKNKQYAERKYKLQDIDVISIIHKLQKPKMRKNRRLK